VQEWKSSICGSGQGGGEQEWVREWRIRGRHRQRWVYTPKHGLHPLELAQEAIPCAGVAISCNRVRRSRARTIGCGDRGRCLWRSAYTPKRGLWLVAGRSLVWAILGHAPEHFLCRGHTPINRGVHWAQLRPTEVDEWAELGVRTGSCTSAFSPGEFAGQRMSMEQTLQSTCRRSWMR